jgi:hypothetical protein
MEWSKRAAAAMSCANETCARKGDGWAWVYDRQNECEAGLGMRAVWKVSKREYWSGHGISGQLCEV